MKNAFEAIKRYTMVSSSNNLELFLQSRHTIHMKDTVKVNNKPKEDNLLQINEHTDEQALNNDSFNYFREVEKQLTPRDDKQNSFSFKNADSPQKKFISRGNITTQEELSFSCEASPMKESIQNGLDVTDTAKNIQLQLSKAGFPGSVVEPPLATTTFHN